MTYSTPPGGGMPPPPVPGAMPATRPPRPATVTIAAALMILQAVLSLIGLVIVAANRDILRDVAERSVRDRGVPAGQDEVEAGATFGLVVGVGLSLLIAIAFIVLALLVLRGNNVARIITWVVTGLFLCCTGVGLGFRSGAEAAPDWFNTYNIASAVVSALIYIAIIVLLALPASNAFFRPRPAA